MNSLFTRRNAVLLWFAGVLWFVALLVYPISLGLTRAAEAGLAGGLAAGLLALWWRYRWLRWSLLAVYVLVAGFLAMPGREEYDRPALRQEIVKALQRYEGVRFDMGGEGFLGIDCSGLVRRGTIDGTFVYGIRTMNPLLVRKAVVIWRHDTSAREMGTGAGGAARRIREEKSITSLNPALLHPGDFAITSDGVHALAYLGDNLWLEADPSAGKVIRVNARSTKNPWFQHKVSIMRWRFTDAPFRAGKK